MAALPKAPDLVTIVTPGGVRFTVARQYAPQFQGLTNELEAGGYTLDPSQSGGYNPRMIAGTDTPSQHAFGQAIDVNWRQNPHGSSQFSIPPDVAHALAAKYHMTWGGDWQGPSQDAMHFEVAQDQKPALGMASLPTPPVPVPAGPMGGDQPLSAPAPAPASAEASAQPPPGAAPLLPGMGMPPMPGQPSSLAQAFMQAAAKAQQAQRDQFGVG